MKKDIFTWIKIVFITITCFSLFFISSTILNLYLKDSNKYYNWSFIKEYYYFRHHLIAFVLGIAIIPTLIVFIIIFKRPERIPFVASFIISFLLSLTFAWTLGNYFGNSSLWYLKYTMGIFTGLIFLFMYKEKLFWKLQIISLMAALVAMGFAEQVESFKYFHSVYTPSSFKFDSDSIIMFLAVGVPAYFIPSRVLGKLLLKKN